MTFGRISVLVPTRLRPARLETLLASYARTATAASELVFRVDDDDTEAQARLRQTPWTVLVGPRLEGYRSLPVFFNEMLQAADGDVLMCGNDDMVFQTEAWDRLVLAEANKYPDGIFDLGCATLNEGHFPFSIISRHAADRMGHLNDPRLVWSDLYLRDVMAAFGRAIPMPHVRVDHDWAGHAPDAVFVEARQGDAGNWSGLYWQKHRAVVAEAVARLSEAA